MPRPMPRRIPLGPRRGPCITRRIRIISATVRRVISARICCRGVRASKASRCSGARTSRIDCPVSYSSARCSARRPATVRRCSRTVSGSGRASSSNSDRNSLRRACVCCRCSRWRVRRVCFMRSSCSACWGERPSVSARAGSKNAAMPVRCRGRCIMRRCMPCMRCIMPGPITRPGPMPIGRALVSGRIIMPGRWAHAGGPDMANSDRTRARGKRVRWIMAGGEGGE
jgi:hypothetical protein